MKIRPFIFLILVILLSSCNNQIRENIPFEVAAIPGSSGLVSIKIKGKVAAGSYFVLQAEKESVAEFPLQQWDDSTWVFFKKKELEEIDMDAYRLTQVSKKPRNAVSVVADSNGLTLLAGPKPVLTFNTKTQLPPNGEPAYYQRSGFIHSLYSPSGQTLTDDFPVGHVHQHGIFMAWVNTTFKGEKVDFWNQQHQLGTVRLLEVTDTLSGPVFAQFKARLEHVSLKHGPALLEEWTITVYHTDEDFLIDFQSVQKAATADTLFLNQYHYGGFAFRATPEWNSADSVHFTNEMQIMTSLGDGRDSSNHTRPEWIAGYGTIDHQMTGLAIMGHPSNFRHPQYVRVHPEMPYFCFPPVVDMGFSIVPGDVFISNYRLLAFSGPPSREKIEQIWQDYQKSK